MADVKFEIKQNILKLETKGDWIKELNLVSWNDKEPVYDFRSWNPDHTKMSKGVTLTKEEFEELKNILKEI
jgi:hypothetical protein